MQNFNEAGLPQPLFHRIEQIGYVTPTPIQAKTIPLALEGKDILGSAQTGTGKTASYGLPLVTKLLTNQRGSSLVLLPTRELAAQVMQELKKFIGNSKIKTSLLIGGEPMPKQLNQLKDNPRLIVGTPGRINDHLKRGSLKLHDTNFLVLDEADRMLDMGFGIQLEDIAKYLTAERQTLLFSATLPKNIEALSSKYLKNPIRISVGTTHSPAQNVTQEHVQIADHEKYPKLLDELHDRQGSVIIFVKTKHSADRMANKLKKDGHKTDALHGDLRQSKRNRVITNFRKQHYRILVATDVAARGLDIPHIEHVINYNLPQNPEDYIHRIGRTARAGADGHAMNFVSGDDIAKWNAIQRLLYPGDNENIIGSGKKGKFKPRRHSKPNGKSGHNKSGNRSKNKKTFGKKQGKAQESAKKRNSSKPKNKKFNKPKSQSQQKKVA